MMTVFLAILRVIGIVLLWILGILLVLILLVLFVPVRYKADGAVKTKPETEYHLNASFSFLLHLVRGSAAVPEDPVFRLKVLWFTVFRYDLSGKGKDEAEQEEEHGQEATETEAVSGENEARRVDKKHSFNPSAVYDKLKAVWKKAERFYTLLDSETFYRAKTKIFANLPKILRAVLPKEWEAEGSICPGDPAAAGMLEGVFGMLLPVTGDHLGIAADFEGEERYANLSFRAAGKVRIIRLMPPVLSIVLDRNVRHCYKTFRKITGDQKK